MSDVNFGLKSYFSPKEKNIFQPTKVLNTAEKVFT